MFRRFDWGTIPVIEDMMKTVTKDALDRCEEDIVNTSPNQCSVGYSWLDKSLLAISYEEYIDVTARNADIRYR